MTDAQRQQLKTLLQKLEADLSQQGPERIEPNRSSEAEVGGDEDEQPLNEMLQAIASNRNRTHEVMLVRVRKALRKLEKAPDELGECEDCGDEIPIGRLKAMPYAELCVACQSAKDAPKGGATRKKLTDYR